MARKLQNVIIEKDRLSNMFRVWMDDDIVNAVRDIPGVIKVAHPMFEDTHYVVLFDPRYDWEELQSEIETLANSYAEG